MRALAVVQGARNVSIVVAGGVHFEGLLDTAAAVNTWPLRLPTVEVLFAPLPASPFDPDALPVDVGIGSVNDERGVTWTLQDVTFNRMSTTQQWFLITLSNGQHIPRGSRIAITNAAASITRCNITCPSSFIYWYVALVYISSPGLVLRDGSSQLLVRNTQYTLEDTVTRQMILYMSILYSLNSPLTLYDGSQLVVNGSTVSAMNNTIGSSGSSMLLSILYSPSSSLFTLYNGSQVVLDSNTVSAVHGRSTSYLSIIYLSFTLHHDSQIVVNGSNTVHAINSSSDSSINLHLVYCPRPLTLYKTSQVVLYGGNTVSAINSSSVSSMSLYLIRINFSPSFSTTPRASW